MRSPNHRAGASSGAPLADFHSPEAEALRAQTLSQLQVNNGHPSRDHTIVAIQGKYISFLSLSLAGITNERRL